MRGAVLGLGGSNHDFSAALVIDGEVAVAVEDERLQRVKRGSAEWHSQPARDAAHYCLETAGLSIADLDGIFACDDLERPADWIDWQTVRFLNHHLCHAAAAFYSSTFDDSALLVIDGHGNVLDESHEAWAVETITVGQVRRPSPISVQASQLGYQKRSSSSWRHVTTNSIGWLYKIVTMAIGLGSTGEGKTMGLAAYGSPVLTNELRDHVTIGRDGTFEFNPYAGIWDWLTDVIDQAPDSFQVKADLAFAVQEVFGDAVVAAAQHAYESAPTMRLCYGGGCALNTLGNSRILAETPFNELFVFPASGDNGLAVGAALFGYHELNGETPSERPSDWQARVVYTGREYSDSEVSAAVATAPVAASAPTDLVAEVAAALAVGSTVAVCRGRSELGPRALGNRSLLASPSTAAMRDHINLNIKQRESFRPLAPVVPIEHAGTYFEGPAESPFMLLVSTVVEKYRAELPAITHHDGTARIQTVRQVDNPFLHQLLLAVGELTGTPVLLNTSLNFPGAPIVETPSDAIHLFVQRPIDLLVLDKLLVRKFTPWVEEDQLSAYRR